VLNVGLSHVGEIDLVLPIAAKQKMTRGTSGLRAHKKTDYKALSEGLVKGVSFFSTPAYASTSTKKSKPKKKSAAPKKAKASAGDKKASKSKSKGPKYRDLIIEAIRATQKPVKGASLARIRKYLAEKHPEKSDRVAIRLALRHGVTAGVFVKTLGSFRVAAGVATKKNSRSKKPKAAGTDASAGDAKKTKAPKKVVTKKATPAKRASAASKKKAAAPRVRKAPSATATAKATVFDNSTEAPKAAGVTWQYHHGIWKDYKEAASDVVEAAYQEWLRNPYTDVRAIKSGDWEYQVDFTNMRQTNIQHENHTQRDIRRHVLE